MKHDTDDTLPSEEPDEEPFEITVFHVSQRCTCGWRATARTLAAVAVAVHAHCVYKHGGH